MSKETKINLMIVVVAALVGLSIYYFAGRPTKDEVRKQIINEQKQELDALRGISESLTEEEKLKQGDELDELREGKTPLSEEEKQKQQEELDVLRQQN